jgi:transposase
LDTKTKSKLDAGTRRRVRAGRRLQARQTPAEVGVMVRAPRQTAYRWHGVLESEGLDALRRMNKAGRPARLGAEELSRLQAGSIEGATTHGFVTPPWTLKRVRLFIGRRFGVRYSDVHIWRLLGQLGFVSFPAR